jgi:hypothetical protein
MQEMVDTIALLTLYAFWFVALPFSEVDPEHCTTWPPGLIADGPREREPQIRNSGEKAVGQSLIPLAEHGQSMAGHDSAGVSLKSMLGHSSIHSNSLLGYKNIPSPH